jgi:hypothetical protein
LVSSFFGLTSKEAFQYHQSIYNQIHEIVFHGGGGYDWATVFNMPIWLRRFTFDKIKKWKDAEAEAIKKAKKGSGKQGGKTTKNILDDSGRINPPNFKNKSSYK